MTVVFASTQRPNRHELDQWLTSPSVYADGVVMYVRIWAVDAVAGMLSGARFDAGRAAKMAWMKVAMSWASCGSLK